MKDFLFLCMQLVAHQAEGNTPMLEILLFQGVVCNLAGTID